jgi:hypothetical protein
MHAIVRRRIEMATTTHANQVEDHAHHGELQRLLTKLCVAITTGDGHAAARLWEVPAFVLGDSMSKPFASIDELGEFFGGARAQYNARGITETRPEIKEEDWISDNVVRVRVRWPYLDANNREIGAETSDYVISRDGSGKLKLRIAIMRGVEGDPNGENKAAPS